MRCKKNAVSEWVEDEYVEPAFGTVVFARG